MKTTAYLSALALGLGLGVSTAQAASPGAGGKPIVQTTCADYLALDETFKPKFIYYAVGHTRKGDPAAVLDVAGTDTIQPELDEYCKVNLTKSAYERVMKSSIASEKTNR
ncbi:MAG: HdeA/HdeB family chaperone [Pseudomonadota bacterium]|nr:HdeA/HdeB family chaperone [Pseudomonadota bacterium]